MSKNQIVERAFEADLPGAMYNLANTLTSLSEIDTAILGKDKQTQIKRIKMHIVEALHWCSQRLPKIEVQVTPKTDQENGG